MTGVLLLSLFQKTDYILPVNSLLIDDGRLRTIEYTEKKIMWECDNFKMNVHGDHFPEIILPGLQKKKKKKKKKKKT